MYEEKVGNSSRRLQRIPLRGNILEGQYIFLLPLCPSVIKQKDFKEPHTDCELSLEFGEHGGSCQKNSVRGRLTRETHGSGMKMCACVPVQSCPAVYDPTDCSLLSFTVRGLSQARILEQVAISYSRGWHLLHCRWILHHRTTRKPSGMKIASSYKNKSYSHLGKPDGFLSYLCQGVL